MSTVAVFTDTYLPTINGVTYTITGWRDRLVERGHRLYVVYPRSNGQPPSEGEYPVRSLPFPFYDEFRVGLPRVPSEVTDSDLVHVHTPFHVGFGGVRLARDAAIPMIASYHTPTSEYTDYLVPWPRVSEAMRHLSIAWERWFFDRADLVLAPSETTKRHLRDRIGLSTPIEVVPNGVETDLFRPVETQAFEEAHSLDTGKPLVGYTGRHGHEKRLDELVDAVAGLDVTLVVGGDGPARSALEERARTRGVDARFLGFVDRAALPSLYSALDVFAFPSPVETQGIVALEAMACGTPVVGADAAALSETIDHGTTGFHYESGDVAAFQEAIERTLDDHDRLQKACLDRRESTSVERTVDRLEEIYASV